MTNDRPNNEILKDLQEPELREMMDDKWNRAYSTMRQRTVGYPLFTRISHNQSIYDKTRTDVYSEGSTQAIKRKIRSQVIQRVPDGQIATQFDKNSIEQVETEFIFKNKIMRSEYDGRGMLKNLWRAFSSAYDYGFACIRTGFEKDTDGDYRSSWKSIHWNDIYPAPDADYIEDAEWYIVREYVSRSELKAIWNEETHFCTDPTYNSAAVGYILKNNLNEGSDPVSRPFADQKKAVANVESIEVRTLYKRGDDEFISFIPSLGCRLRTVKNYDPRKDVPLHFLILDPDPEFPLGCSSIMWTISQQQFADAFQTSAYDTLLLATNPPLMGFGNITPAKIKMKAKAFWPMGTNQNNKIEKFPVETTTITQYNSVLEGVQARMMAGMNAADGTIASDANQSSYSKTAPGVQQQNRDKTVTVNQFQKQVEEFFSDWANHALRSYINAMSGKMKMTVDEITRRRIWDIENAQVDPENPEINSIIEEDKIEIDFDKLSTDLLGFTVRVGSLVESEKETLRNNVQEAIVPISQMLNAVSDSNKQTFENVLLKLTSRLLELSDIDVSQETANDINSLLLKAMEATMGEVMNQGSQINQMQQMLMGGAPQQEMPMEVQGGMPPQQPPMQRTPTQVPTVPSEVMPPTNGQTAPQPMPQPMPLAEDNLPPIPEEMME